MANIQVPVPQPHIAHFNSSVLRENMRNLAIPGDDGFVSQALLELGASRSLVFGWLPAPGNYPGGPSYEGRGLEFAAEKINIMEETFRPKSLGMYTTIAGLQPATCPFHR
jgi:hypothetical protein